MIYGKKLLWISLPDVFMTPLVRALVEAVRRVSEETGLHTVALSGGSWHNDYLLNKTVSELKK